MGEGVKQIKIKNRAYYFYNDIILKFRFKLVKNWQKHYKNIDIYYIGYITIKKIDDCESIYSVNPFYLLINHTNRYIEKKNGNKYLVFDSTVDNKRSVKKICRCLEWN